MGKIILVTGGARSGKSKFAENLSLTKQNRVLYIATAIPFDDEMKQRIAKHKQSRGEAFTTIERYQNFKELDRSVFKNNDCAMLDCITIMVTNIMMNYLNAKIEQDFEQQEIIEKKVQIEIEDLISILKASIPISVLVTNEIGMGIVPDNFFARFFRDVAGRINQMIALASDEVYLCVSGIPVKIK